MNKINNHHEIWSHHAEEIFEALENNPIVFDQLVIYPGGCDNVSALFCFVRVAEVGEVVPPPVLFSGSVSVPADLEKTHDRYAHATVEAHGHALEVSDDFVETFSRIRITVPGTHQTSMIDENQFEGSL